MALSPHRIGLIASSGLALVLLFLVVFAVASSMVTRDAASRAIQANEISDLFQQAREAVITEESLERKYRLEPGRDIAASHRVAAGALTVALESVRAREDVADRVLIDVVLQTHQRYLDATGRMFAAVDAGDTARVLAIDRDEVDLQFSAIETLVDQAAIAHHGEVAAALTNLDQVEQGVFWTTPVVFTIGLGLLVLFWRVLRSYQRLIEQSRQQTLEDTIARVKSDAERDAALSAVRTKDAFLATMSHELRTPLTAILGYSDLLEAELSFAGESNYVGDVRNIRLAGQHLLEVINDVLDLSKIEAGKMSLVVGPIALPALIDDVVTSVQPLIAQNANRFRLVVEGPFPNMQSDATRVRQVLLNLLSNAAKFTEQGEVILRIASEQRAQETWICLSVSDTGIGISGDQIERLFQPFTQVDQSASRRYGGTGLGLAISKQLCVLLGGAISVKSTPGRGSTFTVELPAIAPAPTS